MKKKYLIVTMSDNSQWQIPAQFIAEQRAEYYAKRDYEKNKSLNYQTLFEDEVEYALTDEDEIIDWASNNMNCVDVKDIAEELPSRKKELDFEDEWTNANKEIVKK